MKIVFGIKDIFANVPMKFMIRIVLGEVSASVYNGLVQCKVVWISFLYWHNSEERCGAIISSSSKTLLLRDSIRKMKI
jgi:hypothetical protein